MKNKLAIILGGILVSGLSIGAVTKVNEPVKYDYLTIIQDNVTRNLFITMGGEKIEKISIKGEVSNQYDFRSIQKKVKELQDAGWEVEDTEYETIGYYSTNYILLKKAK